MEVHICDDSMLPLPLTTEDMPHKDRPGKHQSRHTGGPSTGILT